MRAILLEDLTTAREIAPGLAEAVPELAAGLSRFLAAASDEQAELEAVMLVLRHPGVTPFVHEGVGRMTSLDAIERDGFNWWWWDRFEEPSKPDLLPGFISQGDRDQAVAEWKRIRDAGDGYAWLMKRVMAEAQKDSSDPWVEEALFRVITALTDVDLQWGRYRMPYELRGQCLEAFDTLHQQFPERLGAL